MKNRWLIGTTLAIGLYLYVAYLHIYNSRPAVINVDPTTEEVITIANEVSSGTGLVYAALGDSLVAGTGAPSATQTFPYQLGTYLSDKNKLPVTVINLGVPGATAADVWQKQIPYLGDRDATIITVTIGTNDVHLRTPLPDFKKSLQTGLTALTKNSAKVYIMTIPYLGDRSLVWPPYRHYLDWQTKRYNQIIHEVATESGIAIIDLYGLTRAEAWVDSNYYSEDGFHPSAAGYKLWGEKIYDALNY